MLEVSQSEVTLLPISQGGYEKSMRCSGKTSQPSSGTLAVLSYCVHSFIHSLNLGIVSSYLVPGVVVSMGMGG